MNEREFKAKIQRKIKPHCHIQSMSSYATNGTPDYWISGPKGDLWLEVKYDEKTKGEIKPKLTPIQKNWLDARHKEGRNVMVVVGTSPDTCVFFRNGLWFAHLSHRASLDSVIQLILEDVI